MAAASPIAEPLVVVAGSNNPVKVAAVLAAFQAAFPGRTIACTGVSAASGVSDQPTGNDETRTGAYNRAQAVVEAAAVEELEPEFAVGLEGGVLDETWTGPSGAATQSMSCMAWMAVLHVPSGTWGTARTGSFALPEAVAKLVRSGIELGIADDMVFKRSNSKHGSGAVGLLTAELIDRKEYYIHALTLALCPFLTPDAYEAPAVPGVRHA